MSSQDCASRPFEPGPLAALLLLLAPILTAPTALALNVVVAGELTNAATSQPVVGATVTVRFDQQSWRSSSDEQGLFATKISLPNRPSLHLVQVQAEHPLFATKSREVTIKDGNADPPITRVDLFPAALAECLIRDDDLVVVGHFRPPLGEAIPDLPERLAETLRFDLLTVMQQLHLPQKLQPQFVPCRDAKPRTPTQGPTLARALRAHAVLHGNVSRRADDFQVRAHVSDAYDISSAAVATQSSSVDLENPSAGQLNPQTYAAVLNAIAAGIASRRDCSGALALMAAAQTLDQGPSTLLQVVEANCGVER